MKCPSCNVDMIRRESKYGKGNYWWGCSNFPKCRITSAEHPDGTLMSTPADQHLKKLRREAHDICEQIWGEWGKMSKSEKKGMYMWMKQNTAKGHIGLMDETELKDLMSKLLTTGFDYLKANKHLTE